jgi:hypothetical protein
MPGFDIQSAYRAMAARLTKLAGEAPGSRAARLSGNWRRPAAATQPASDEPDETAMAYRRRLQAAFMFAHERGQLAVAVSLLKAGTPAKYLKDILATGHAEAALPLLSQGIPSKNLLAILASMPRTAGASSGLAKRIAAYRAVSPDGQPPAPPSPSGSAAAQMIRAYNKAIGQKPPGDA